MSDAIIIPDDLRPADGRFGSGPSKVRPEGVAALNAVSKIFLGSGCSDHLTVHPDWQVDPAPLQPVPILVGP